MGGKTEERKGEWVDEEAETTGGIRGRGLRWRRGGRGSR